MQQEAALVVAAAGDIFLVILAGGRNQVQAWAAGGISAPKATMWEPAGRKVPYTSVSARPMTRL